MTREEHLAKGRAKYAANREKILSVMRAQYAANPEKKRNSSKVWAKNNPEKARSLKAAWYKANKDKSRDRLRKWRSINRDRENAARRALYSANPNKRLSKNKEWIGRNIERARKTNLANHHRRYKHDPEFRVATLLRGRLRIALYKYKKSGYCKPGSAVRDLGCSITELLSHIEKLFQPDMSWDNYGQWHLDHKRPLASFNLLDPEQFKQACHFTNYQPLWAKDNLSKGSKYNPIDEAA